MKTLTYTSANLPVKDRLTITNLLGLFASRMNAKWVSVTQPRDHSTDITLIDLDQPDGIQSWETTTRPGRIAVTENDRWTGRPFISRPIRACGPNGVMVLFNSIAAALSSPSTHPADSQREPAQIRMSGRLEVAAAPVTAIRPQAATAQKPATTRVVAPPPPPPPGRPGIEQPIPVRVTVRWGPPEPVFLTPLTRMPGARIHRLGEAAQVNVPDFSIPGSSLPNQAPAPVIQPILEVAQQRSWSAPEVEKPPRLVEMPVAHRPVAIETPGVPAIGRSKIKTSEQEELKLAAMPDDTPVLRAAPPQWRLPEPEVVKDLIDFRSLLAAPAYPGPQIEVGHDTSETVPVESSLSALEAALSGHGAETAAAAMTQGPFGDVNQNSGIFPPAIASDEYPEEFAVIDATADWWGAADLEADNSDHLAAHVEGSLLLTALKAIKASGQPSIVEITGLPAVCVVPARNVYFTTAPSARLEIALQTRSEVTWRACSSEAEARQSSGTEQSRQASLEQLSWTASLLMGPIDIAGMADRAVRLRRWPPITESRGRSKFLRYANLLSGAQATPRELAEITGDPLEEIVCFVSACSHMNLLDISGQAKPPVAPAPTRTTGVGVLRAMIEQLAPPRI